MTACLLVLALLLDASASVPRAAWETLAEGHAAAFEAPEVRRAIRAGGPVAVRAWQFSDRSEPMTPWRILAADADARAFAAELRAAPRVLMGGTATGEAVLDALAELPRSPCPGAEAVIDVATDGPQNMGVPASVARDAAAARGVRINVLAIETQEGDPEAFARAELATADGFVLRVEAWQDVPRALIRKISTEIARR